MSDGGVLHICSGANECGGRCFHGTPHSHIIACDLPCNKDGMEGNCCSEHVFCLHMDKTKAQELLNVISMAAGEGVEYEFTDDMAVKLDKFIDGRV